MFRIVHGFSLAVFITLAWTCASYAQSVPVTVEGSVAGFPGLPGFPATPGLTGTVRGTCDPAIEEVIKNQAWLAAQREITQNANLYTRPDSVLSLSCFDQWLNHQNNYAENNFPVDPDESEGLLLGGLFTDLIIVLPDDIITSVDPNLTTGYVQFGILEILVLDQLENVGSITGQANDALGFSLCGGTKDYYIEDAYPDLMLGDRAKHHNPDPWYLQINSGLDSMVGSSSYNCDMMNRVWTRTKCYDFATEEDDFYNSALAYMGTDHDGFYRYLDFVTPLHPIAEFNDYVSSGDKRLEPDVCAPPNSNILEIPSVSDLACWVQIHGVMSMPSYAAFIPTFTWAGGLTFPGGGKTWGAMYSAANPSAGAAGGVDAYEHLFEVVSGDPAVPCYGPIRTGFVVTRKTVEYYDAFCPNPGCFFTAPATLAGTGTCSR